MDRRWPLTESRGSAEFPSVKPWSILSRKTLVDRRWLRVSEDRVLLPNGTVIEEFHLLHTPRWASAVAVTANRDVVMVEQYRHGLGHGSLELPSGVIDEGEEPLRAAQRELQEETGYVADQWHFLMEVSPEPSRSTARAFCFLALGAERRGQAQPEATEVIAVRLRKIEDLLGDVEHGRIDHGVHVAAILLAERRGYFRPR